MKKHKGIIFKAKSKISQSIRNINKPKMKRIEINEELTIKKPTREMLPKC